MGKYKVVVDTNIFISAFLGSKNSKLIVRDIFTGQYSLIMSLEQLKEIKSVLQRPKSSKYIHPTYSPASFLRIAVSCGQGFLPTLSCASFHLI